ncbi:MAG: hypothetical protein DME25_06380 [Verrucomicrobia bacterium]|nr:MAG: hypothetical protein DME25_06380 [Verrucomicrobiota bacterium]
MPPAAQTLSERFDPKMLAALEGLDFKARYVMEGFLSGLHDSPFHGFSVEFSDYRNYQPGDDLRHLDWRLFARTDRLCIKRYMQETNVRFYVVCDTSASMQYRGTTAWGSKLECARILAAALTWFLLKQNDAAGMVTLSGGPRVEGQVPSLTTGPRRSTLDSGHPAIPEFIRPSQRPNQFGLILRQLELLRAAGGPCLAELLQHTVRLVHRRSVILFFSDLLEPSDDVALGFKQLRFHGHEVIIFQVLDRDELEFPFTEPKVFEDLETGVRRVVSPAAARETYLERFNAFMAAYQDLFHSLEMSHCVVRTDENPWRALAVFLSERKRLK